MDEDYFCEDTGCTLCWWDDDDYYEPLEWRDV